MLEVAALSAGLVVYNGVLPNLPGGFQDRVYVPLNMAVTAGLVCLGLFALDLSWADLGVTGEGVWRSLGWGTVFGLAVGAPGLVSSLRGRRLPRRLGRVEAFPGPRAEREAAYRLLVRIPVGTALFEEVAFRGLMVGLLLGEELGTVEMVVVSSGVFGLYHVGPVLAVQRRMGFNDLRWTVGFIGMGVMTTFVGGLGFGFIRVETGNVAGSVLAHTMINDLGFLGWWLWMRRGREGGWQGGR